MFKGANDAAGEKIFRWFDALGREDSNKDGMIDILSQLLSYGLAMQKLMHNSLRH
ncbi:hypothetical protein [Arsenophonus sp.]|uniref:hypothetical protein n=1 Tax=Arsenophonus sp. TaxID=1872640 RepID=UPI00387A4EB1